MDFSGAGAEDESRRTRAARREPGRDGIAETAVVSPFEVVVSSAHYSKRKIQVTLVLLAAFHLFVLGVFLEAPPNILVGVGLLFVFWGVYGLYLFLEH